VKITDYDLDSDGVEPEVTFDDFTIGVDGTGQFDDGVVV